MKKTPRFILLLVFMGVIAAVVGACATKSYINVNYHLPATSDDLRGKRISLDCKDVRAAKTIFGPKAEAEFKHFSGLFALSVSQGKKPVVTGAFDLPSLFKEALKRRLENLGLDIVTRPEKTTPVVEIVIKRFRLDLVERKWVAGISYDARLLKDNLLLATKTVTGDAERIKVLGRGDAEKVLGEIFTDVVNRLDFHELLGHATQ